MTTNLIVSNDALAAKQDYAEAVHDIETLETFVHAKVDEITAIARNETRTPEWKQKQTTGVRDELRTRVQSDAESIRHRLQRAETRAKTALAGEQDDPQLEARKTRAITRVSRLLDSGTHLIAAAEVFAQAGDLDALRTLRDEVPSYAAASSAGKHLSPEEVTRNIEQLTMALDRLAKPLLPEREQYAVDVRSALDKTGQWLDVVIEYGALSSVGSPGAGTARGRLDVAKDLLAGVSATLR